MSEIEPPEIIEPITVSPEITHEEIVKTVDESATNEINEINVNSLPPHQVSTQQPNAYEPIASENEIANGPDQTLPELNKIVDSGEITTEQPPAPISQRKNRRKGKKHHAHEDNSIDEEFASRLDMSCADAETSAPQIENAHVANYLRYKFGL